jgi:hypothetical protein
MDALYFLLYLGLSLGWELAGLEGTERKDNAALFSLGLAFSSKWASTFSIIDF